MTVWRTKMVTIAMTVWMTRTVTISKTIMIVITSSSLQDKRRKVRFFQKTFLVADPKVEVVLRIPFLTLVVYVVSIQGSPSEIKYFHLFSPNCLTWRQNPCYNYINIFLLNFMPMLLKQIGINNHPINLVDNLSNHPLALQYCLFIRRMVAFNYASEISIIWL